MKNKQTRIKYRKMLLSKSGEDSHAECIIHHIDCKAKSTDENT